MTASRERRDRLAEQVTRLMAQKQIPGVAVGILQDDQTATAGFGVTNVDHPLSVDDGTFFQIGSITKTYLGTAVMRLVEHGELDLEATVRTYLPDFQVADKAAAAGATVRHLLTHLGGWAGDFFHDSGMADDALARYVADMVDLPQLAPLGTVWSYNNAGFAVAGLIVEQITGEPFEAALQELVLDPLGLARTFFGPDEAMTHRFVVGHSEEEGVARVARPWTQPRSIHPMGGLVCDLQDLLRYARFHLGDGTTEDGTQVLSLGSLAQMRAPQARVWGKEARGLPWALTDLDGVQQVSHGGGTKGQVTLLALVPARNFALAVLTNGDEGGFVTDRVRRWVLREYLDLDDPLPAPIESSEADLVQYTGRYRSYHSDLELGVLAGRLVGQVTFKRGFPSEDVPPPPLPPPMSVGRCEEDRLLVLDGPFKDLPIDVIRAEDGSIGWLRRAGRLHVREV